MKIALTDKRDYKIMNPHKANPDKEPKKAGGQPTASTHNNNNQDKTQDPGSPGPHPQIPPDVI